MRHSPQVQGLFAGHTMARWRRLFIFRFALRSQGMGRVIDVAGLREDEFSARWRRHSALMIEIVPSFIDQIRLYSRL